MIRTTSCSTIINQWGVSLILAIVMTGLLGVGRVGAAPPPDSQTDQCIECHEAETEAWLASPHAAAGSDSGLAVICQDCHGPYVEDHPEAGLMRLTVDSEVCHNCHAGTFDQWQNTAHAEAGVQCIGCHLSHSQEARLTDDNRCTACHRDDHQSFAYSPHGLADIACTDCHMTAVQARPNNENLTFISTRLEPAVIAPDHDFTAVSDVSCLGCHTESAHTGLPPTTEEQADCTRLASTARTVPILASKLESAESANATLAYAAPIALGFGITLGTTLALGIILACAYINQRRGEQ